MCHVSRLLDFLFFHHWLQKTKKKILNEDRAKAIEIENKLKRKRSSIDSGVMTGSYIECLKNGENQEKENLAPNQHLISDLPCNDNSEYELNHTFLESEKNSTDNFLRSALEDKEFREFFYNTAERIFNDNNLENIDDTTHNSSITYKTSSNDINSAFKDSDFSSRTEHFIDPSDSSKVVETSSEVNIVSSMTVGNQEKVTSENLPGVYIEETLSSPQRPVRRNSYTLESPSPVLIEHMANEIKKNEGESIKWKSLYEKKDCNKNLGFKTFLSTTKPRKTWNKRALNNCPFSKISNSSFNQPPRASRVLLKKAKTFTKVKSNSESEDTNYSLPCSSRTSPTLLSRSVDCIKSMVETFPNKSGSNSNLSTKFLPKVINEINSPVRANAIPSIKSESKINTLGEVVDVGFVLKETSKASVLSSIFSSEDSNNELNKDILSIAQSEVYENRNQISNDTQQMVCNGALTCAQTNECTSDQFKTDPLVETDEIVSVCSSLSLSKFMPVHETVSRPSTAEDISTLFSRLQLQHECQIAELLEKQYKEKVMLAMLHSDNASLSSRSTTNMSFFDLSHENSFGENEVFEDKKTPCNRELFPRQLSDFDIAAKNFSVGEYSSAKYQEAALKLTAYVRGYLTRRLLKTEKVQQLIDVIKESLNCAFSLQSETELKRNDLELHKRLENQMTAALYELQNIISAPVSQRMAIIATDREKLRRPPSRPSSAVSSATQKSRLRRQQSVGSGEKKTQENRSRAKSFCAGGNPGLVRSGSFVKSDSPIVLSSSTTRKPWR